MKKHINVRNYHYNSHEWNLSWPWVGDSHIPSLMEPVWGEKESLVSIRL